jgi:hypothetical protein
LLVLRYRILWAQVRSSRTGIAWLAFLAFGLLLIMAVVAVGGMAAITAGVSAGRAEVVARIALGSLFVNMLISSTLLGFGVNQVFSDVVLRRFPLTRFERILIRQVLALLEPLWLIALALYAGCAVGASLLGAAPLWVTLPAAAVLVCSNYLLARVILAVAERLLATSLGSFLVVVLVQLLALAPILFERLLGGSADAAPLRVLAVTPPFLAAAMIAGKANLLHGALLVIWTLASGAALLLLEARPVVPRAARTGGFNWHSWIGSVASVFPRTWEPLVATTLRYYLRSPRVRVSLVVTLPIIAFLVTPASGRVDSERLFLRVLAFSPMAGALATASLSENVFGFEASGLRRLLLSPVRAMTMLRARTIVPLMIGAVYSGLAAFAWLLLSADDEPRKLAMLLTHSLTGLLVFEAFGLWASVVAPKRAAYDEKYSNQLSAAAFIVMLTALGVIMLVPIWIHARFMPGPIEQYWWATLIGLAVGLACYELMLRVGGYLFEQRRERIMAIVEGRG